MGRLHIAQGERRAGRPRNVGPTKPPLITQRRRARGCNAEGRGGAGKDRLAGRLRGYRRGRARRALACAAGQVDRLYLGSRQRALVITDFVDEAIKELAHITAIAGRRAVKAAYGERATRIHRGCARRALRVHDTVDIQAERSPIPGSSEMSELADRYFAGARGLKKREMADSELKGNEHPRASCPCEQQAMSIALAEDDFLVYRIAHLRQRLDPSLH